MDSRMVCQLLADLGIGQMVLADDNILSHCGDKFVCPVQRGFEHRSVAQEPHVLLGQAVAAQPLDERSKPHAVATCEDDGTTILAFT
jgi:hypothetical protein